MVECVVDCEVMPCGDGKALLLPYSFGGHVHEVLTRCADCYHYCQHSKHCRLHDEDHVPPDGYCHRAQVRGERWQHSVT